MFYEAAAMIVQEVARILSGYVEEYHKGEFQCEHDEIGEIEDLIDRVHRFEENQFADLKACQEWLRRVADFLPQLWD